jgi:orotate phosphoribosyltransferase
VTPDQVIDLYRESGGLLEGHFRLRSGAHSARFLQSTTVMQDPRRCERLARALAERLGKVRADAVVGPAMGGIWLAYEVARQLGLRALFAEKTGGGEMRIRDALTLGPGERVIAVEDVITKGGSVAGASAAAEARGATLAAVACIIDRSQVALPWDLVSLARLTIPSYPPDDCPLCRNGVALQEV